MYTTTFTVALFAALPAVVSAGNAIVHNYCSEDVYLWSLDSSNYSPPMHTIAPGGSYSEPYRVPQSGGVSIKIAKSPNLYANPPTPITQFEYTLSNMIFYDISNINGDPFAQGGINLIPSDSSCASKMCPAGLANTCKDAYNHPDDNWATAGCSSSSDTTFDLCPSQKGSSSEAAAPAAAPVKNVEPAAPAVTHAPAAPATTVAPNLEEVVITADGHPDWVWTTFFTKVVTVYARDAAPNAEPTAAPAAHEKAEDKKHKKHGHPHHGHHHGADEK